MFENHSLKYNGVSTNVKLSKILTIEYLKFILQELALIKIK